MKSFIPIGTHHKMRRLRLKKLRQKNLASATRHLADLERRYASGVVVDSLGRENPHPRDESMAESFAEARKATVKLAKRV
jgi:hypothetical protein